MAGLKGTWLTNTEHATIDEKGRLIFSKKKREILGEGFCVVVGASGCLEVHTSESWEQMASDVVSHDKMNLGRKKFARMFFGLSETGLDFDAQGRVVIPARLRKAAGLNKDVSIVGCGDYCEIWDKARYEDGGGSLDESQFSSRELEYEATFLRMKDRWPELPRQ